MFERYIDRARRVVVLAQEEAKTLRHNYIGTEHLLLGLVHEGEGVAAQALKSLGISLDDVREQVEDIIGQGQQRPTGHIPFTPRARKVCELALREALLLGHSYVGTEHILLGLIREGEGVGAQVLFKLGADLNRVRQEVITLLGGHIDDKTRDPQSSTSSLGRPAGAFAGVTVDVNGLEGSVQVYPVDANLEIVAISVVFRDLDDGTKRTFKRTFPSTKKPKEEEVPADEAQANGEFGTVSVTVSEVEKPRRKPRTRTRKPPKDEKG